MQLDDYRIAGIPDVAYYIPNFISEEEEEQLLYKIPKNRWVQLSNRSLQAHPTTLTANNALPAAELPTFLSHPVIDRLLSMGAWPAGNRPNHVLINKYEPGQGILAHEDGPAYHSKVATLSLSGHTVLILKPIDRDSSEIIRILQEPRSMLITSKDLYTAYRHEIEEICVDKDIDDTHIANFGMLGNSDAYQATEMPRQLRISLTYRQVLKIMKGFKIGK